MDSKFMKEIVAFKEKVTQAKIDAEDEVLLKVCYDIIDKKNNNKSMAWAARVGHSEVCDAFKEIERVYNDLLSLRGIEYINNSREELKDLMLEVVDGLTHW